MARPRPAIKLVPLALFCKKCQKEVTAVSVKSNRDGKRFNIDYDSFRVEEAAETGSHEQSHGVCEACGTPLTSPIEFFCPHCFEASGYYDDGMHVQGQLLNSIDCVKSMLKEFEYIKSPYWHGREFFVDGHLWRPYNPVLYDDAPRLTLIEAAASRGLLLRTGNIVVAYDRDNACKMYMLETHEGWYCFELDLDGRLDLISPDLRAHVKYDTIATEIFRVPNLRFE